MGKYKILVKDTVLDGEELKKGKTYELPWQIGSSYVANRWAEKVEQKEEVPPAE